MMLWYKAWRETRVRFYLVALFLIGFSCIAVLFYSRYCSQMRWEGEVPPSYQKYLWQTIYRDGNSLREIFCILVLLLGAGGLHNERAGSVAFTLSLPVPRWQLILARSGVGLLEVTALSFVSPVVLSALSPTVNESYAAIQGAQFGFLWTVCGASIYSLALLCSTLLEGEYSAALASLAIFVAYSIATGPPANINAIMSGEGMPYFSTATFGLIGLPGTPLVFTAFITSILLMCAVQATSRQDF
jgi:ABC-type transport system involved in multi-copper enzyme maturation permease subunit